jgi:hypothetical protein
MALLRAVARESAGGLMSVGPPLVALCVRREQRAWAEIYLRGLLIADVPRKNVEATALRLFGAGSRPHARYGLCSISSAKSRGMRGDPCRAPVLCGRIVERA